VSSGAAEAVPANRSPTITNRQIRPISDSAWLEKRDARPISTMDARNRFRALGLFCWSTGAGAIAESGNAVQRRDYLAKANNWELRAASASNDQLKHHFHDIANHWRNLAKQADKIRSSEIAAA